MVALSGCACSSSIDSSRLVFTYRALESLLHHLWSIYNVSGASDLPDSASTRLYDLVSHLAGTDASRSQFESSSTTWWVRMCVRSSEVIGMGLDGSGTPFVEHLCHPC